MIKYLIKDGTFFIDIEYVLELLDKERPPAGYLQPMAYFSIGKEKALINVRHELEGIRARATGKDGGHSSDRDPKVDTWAGQLERGDQRRAAQATKQSRDD